MSRFSVFVSAVSGEFKALRMVVASRLRARGIQVKVQEDFRQEGKGTLEKIHDYIGQCDAVICIVGRWSGAVASPQAVTRLQEFLPEGFAALSYTQWEIVFARRLAKKCLVYVAGEEVAPELPACEEENTELQQKFLHWLFYVEGQDRDVFHTADQLRALVMEQNWPRYRRARPDNLPFGTLGHLFKGRALFIQDLASKLLPPESSQKAPRSVRAMAIHGLGGVGKTRAAVEFAHHFMDRFSAVLFVHAGSPEALRRNVAELVAPTVLDLEEQEDPNEDRRINGVLAWLNKTPGWLLIMDNVDTVDAAAAASCFIARLVGGTVIITSRIGDWPGSVAAVDLGILDLDAATEFLLQRTGGRRRVRDDDAQCARVLAHELGQLALALEQAAAFIRKRRSSFSRYLDQWETRRDQMLEWFDERVMNYPKSVAVTWQTTFDELTPQARSLLSYLSFLSPEPVPETLLDLGTGDSKYDLPRVDDPLSALDDLEAYSLAKRDPSEPNFTIHRLVQQVTRQSIPAEQQTLFLGGALAWVDSQTPEDTFDVRTWSAFEPLVPHVESLVREGDREGALPHLPHLMCKLGNYYGTRMNYPFAIANFRRAVVVGESVFGTSHINFAEFECSLAYALCCDGQLEEAESHFQKGIAVMRAVCVPPDSKLADCLSLYSELLSARGRYEEATSLIREVIAIDETKSDTKPYVYAIHLSNLGAYLGRQNRLDEAEQYFRRALQITEQDLGKTHPEVAMKLGNLGYVCQSTGRLEEAEQLYRRAWEIDERAYGADSLKVADRLDRLAELYEACERTTEAEGLYLRTLSIRESRFGPYHQAIGYVCNRLSILYQNMKRYEEAEPLMRRTISILDGCLGAEHSDTITCQHNLARLLMEMGRADEAKALCRRIVRQTEAALGSDHPDTLASIELLISCLGEEQDTDESIDLRLRLIEAREASGQEEMQTQLALDINNLSVSLKKRGRLEEAESLARKALALDERARGACHPKIPHRLSNLSILLIANGNLAEAEQQLERAWSLKEGSHDLTSARILFLKLAVAFVHGQSGNSTIGRLKTLLSVENLPDHANVTRTWNVKCVIEFLRGHVPGEPTDFMSALCAVLNQESPTSSLDRFPYWQRARPIAVEIQKTTKDEAEQAMN